MKKQTESNIKAHLFRGACYLILLLAVCLIPFALAQRASIQRSAVATSHNSDSIPTAMPTLGTYPDTAIPLSTDTMVTPEATPTNTTSINVSTSTDFDGTLQGDPTTGVVRITDAHPQGTYTVTVTAFDSGGWSTMKTFTLT